MTMGSAVNIGDGHSFKHIDCLQGVMEIDFVTPIRSCLVFAHTRRRWEPETKANTFLVQCSFLPMQVSSRCYDSLLSESFLLDRDMYILCQIYIYPVFLFSLYKSLHEFVKPQRCEKRLELRLGILEKSIKTGTLLRKGN